MNISGIRPGQGFYDYNFIKVNELRSQQIAASQVEQKQAAVTEPEVMVDERPAEQNYTSFHFAQEYKPNETYDMKGADSDIHNLDIEKAVSDLDKDQMLRQYQYFVGDNGADGIVTKQQNITADVVLRSGENFIL